MSTAIMPSLPQLLSHFLKRSSKRISSNIVAISVYKTHRVYQLGHRIVKIVRPMEKDPLTAWAFHEYETHGHHPEITDLHQKLILEQLKVGEHVEIILLGGLLSSYERRRVKKRLSRGKDPQLISYLTFTTMLRTLILTPDGTSIIPIENKRANGVPLLKTIVVYELSHPGEYIWFERTGDMAHRILRIGAGEFILRLPPQPGVPDMPTEALTQGSHSLASRTYLIPTDWKSAEEIAEQHLKYIGFANVRLSPPGNDHGVDVIGRDVAAQVKMTALPVGRPVLQQLIGATVVYTDRACYSTSGYTKDALLYAELHSVALFSIEASGEITPRNQLAEIMERTSSLTAESREWRVAYSYVDEVLSRMLKWLNPVTLYLMYKQSNMAKGRQCDSTQFNRRARAESYWIAAVRSLGKRADFKSGRDMIISYHHAELLLAVAVQADGFDYFEVPERPDDSGKYTASITDFY